VFRVGLNRTSSTNVAVDFETANFSAVAESDYLSRTGRLIIPAGQISATMSVPVIGDTLPERTQTFFVRLNNATGATLSDREAVCAILDDDSSRVTVCAEGPATEGQFTESTVKVDSAVLVGDLEICLFVSNRPGARYLTSAALVPPNRNFINLFQLPETDSGIGTTCSPKPDCVITTDDSSLNSILRGGPPYAGRWFQEMFDPLGLQRNTGARGDWALRVNATQPVTVECWCLTITEPQEGLVLRPARATLPAVRYIEEDEFGVRHEVTASLTSNGRRVAYVPITFEVRGLGGGGDVLVREVIPTNLFGNATFEYVNWVPGEQTIEARAEVDGAIYTDIARVTWTNPCVATQALQAGPQSEASLNTMRSFRDSKLAKSKRGREYSHLYYKLSAEAIRLMMFNPMLMLRSQEIIERYLPVVREMAEGKDVALTEGDLAEIDSFLSYFAAKGSAQFKQSLDGLREDLRNPDVQTEFGVKVTPGPRRGIPGGGLLQSLKRASIGTMLSGFVFAFGFRLARYRNRASRKRAGTRLSVTLAILLACGPILAASLEYSTYLGGTGDDEGTVMALDSEGNVYVAGITDSVDLPATGPSPPGFAGGSQDVFVAKMDATGSRLIYLTYIGGAGQETATGIAIDASGNAWVTGFTDSRNFPTLNALQPDNRGGFDAFVVKLGPAGNLIYSTYLGGSANDAGSGIAIDASGNICLSGITTSQNFPTASALQQDLMGASDLYVAKLSAAGDRLLYSTYLGGSQDDAATSLAADPAGNVYVTGATLSSDFRTANASQRVHGGGIFDGFVAKLNPTGSQLVYSTYLGGGSADRCMRIAVDSSGNAYVTGDTRSTNFPVTNAAQRNPGGSSDAFIAKLNPNGSLAYSTYLGGSGLDGGTAIAVSASGSATVTGFTDSTNFPTVGPVQPNHGGGGFDAFVVKLNASGSAISYSTYLGAGGTDSGFGIAVDAVGNAYVMGATDSSNFPVERPLQPANRGGVSDLFIAKLRSGPSINSAEVRGKKLIVTGRDFDMGARILVDGQSQKTANDASDPSTRLIAKKAGRRIAPGQRVTLQVMNLDGSLSPVFSYTRPAL
jgi:hypothetical protein